VADLQINYDQLHKLANDARSLKEHLDDTVPGLSSGISGVRNRSEAIGSSKLSSSLIKFHYAWEQPFKDAMDRLKDLADLLDGVATKFFDMDSDFAAKANTSLANLVVQNWQARKDEYDLYQRTKDLKFTPSPLWDQNGNLVQGADVPLIPWENPPADPGARPTHIDAREIWNQNNPNNPLTWDGQPAVTDSTYDDQGRITSQTTKNTSTEGLAYEETTTYTYEGTSETPATADTTLKHSDGATETIKTTYHPDGTFTTDNVFTDPANDKNNSSSTTVTTPKPDNGGYTAVSTDQDDKTTTINVTNNSGDAKDVKVVTDDDGTVRTWEGNADTDDWTQTAGPDPYDDSTDEDDDYNAGLDYGGA